MQKWLHFIFFSHSPLVLPMTFKLLGELLFQLLLSNYRKKQISVLFIQSFCQDLWWISLQMDIALISPYGVRNIVNILRPIKILFLPPHPSDMKYWLGVKCTIHSLLAALQICSCPELSSKQKCQHSSRRLMYRESLKICWAKKDLVIAKSSEPSVSNKVTDFHSTVSSEHLIWW